MIKLWLYSHFLFYVNYNVIVTLTYIHTYINKLNMVLVWICIHYTYVTLCAYNIIILMSYELLDPKESNDTSWIIYMITLIYAYDII
jgi:uncharacterized membrane protein